jgi:hypothetical protein
MIETLKAQLAKPRRMQLDGSKNLASFEVS